MMIDSIYFILLPILWVISMLITLFATDITETLMKKGITVEAVDLAYIFGFEEKLSPQTNLTSFLQKSEDSWKKTKQEARGSATVLVWICSIDIIYWLQFFVVYINHFGTFLYFAETSP